MKKIVRTLIIAPAVMLLASCDLSALSVTKDFDSFRQDVNKIKEHTYQEVTISGDYLNNSDLKEIYTYDDGTWVPDESNETAVLLKYLETVQEMVDEINKSYSDTQIKQYFKFRSGVNSYQIDFEQVQKSSDIRFNYKYNKNGYPTSYYYKSSIDGSGNKISDLKFSYK